MTHSRRWRRSRPERRRNRGHSKRVTASRSRSPRLSRWIRGCFPKCPRRVSPRHRKMAIPDMILRKPGPLTPEDVRSCARIAKLASTCHSNPIPREAGDCAFPSGIFRWHGLSARSEGEPDSSGGAHFRCFRRARRHDLDRPYRKALRSPMPGKKSSVARHAV